MKYVLLFLLGFFNSQATAFNFETNQFKGEIFVGNHVGSPILKVLDKNNGSTLLQYSCDWWASSAEINSMSRVSCSRWVSTLSGDDDESIALVVDFDLNDLTKATVEYDYGGDYTFLAKEAEAFDSLAGKYEIKNPARNSIVNTLKTIQPVLNSFLGYSVKSNILTVEMGSDIYRPISLIRVTAESGSLSVTLRLKYNNPSLGNNVYLDKVLDIKNKKSIDQKALKLAIEKAIADYNAAPASL